MSKRFLKVSALATAGLISGCSVPSLQKGGSESMVQPSPAPTDLSSRPAASASATPPKLVPFEVGFVWDRPHAFGPVPASLINEGNEGCSTLNRGDQSFRASGYHPAAADEKGVPFPGGGFFCEGFADKPTQTAEAATVQPAPVVSPKPTEPNLQAIQQKPADQIVVAPIAAEPVREIEQASVPALELVQANMKVWQDSWIAKDPITYLALFHPSFPNISQYSANRQKRMLAAKFIELSIMDAVYREDGDRVIVRFRQKYRSNTFRSDEIKELVWLVNDQRALIIEERFIRR